MAMVERSVFFLVFFAVTTGAANLITSDGTKTRPHCTWAGSCAWNNATKSACATKLCEAAGFDYGSTYVSASNNMCSASYTGASSSGQAPSHYAVVLTNHVDKKYWQDVMYDAQITARCFYDAPTRSFEEHLTDFDNFDRGAAFLVTSDGTQERPHCTWAGSCAWNNATKSACAMKLCESSGLHYWSSGTAYVSASNNMCTATYAKGTANHYTVMVNTMIVEYQHLRSVSADAQITADCWSAPLNAARARERAAGLQVVVTSDGSRERPHCSWNGSKAMCDWDAARQSICARKLCEASGYGHSGEYVSASDNLCNTSFAQGQADALFHHYVVDRSVYAYDKAAQGHGRVSDAQITANCAQEARGAILLTSDGSATRPHCSWAQSCVWDSATKSACAAWLCGAAGYTSGSRYITSSNNMCTQSFANGTFWSFVADKSRYANDSPPHNAQIIADCFLKPVSVVAEGLRMRKAETHAEITASSAVLITSDGTSAQPHCAKRTNNSECIWDAATKAMCAMKLCQASGHDHLPAAASHWHPHGGTFVSASNNMCNDSFSEISNTYSDDRSSQRVWAAKITADCNTVAIKSAGTQARPHCSWSASYDWNSAAKHTCATKLCEAAGYLSGASYVDGSVLPSSSNSYVLGKLHFYSMDRSTFEYSRPGNYAVVRALCSTAVVKVTSDGTESRPHCSWFNSCTWDRATQHSCATNLCQAAGYSLGGTFVSASNNMCDASLSLSFGPQHYFVADKSRFEIQWLANEAQIVAACRTSAIPLPAMEAGNETFVAIGASCVLLVLLAMLWCHIRRPKRRGTAKVIVNGKEENLKWRIEGELPGVCPFGKSVDENAHTLHWDIHSEHQLQQEDTASTEAPLAIEDNPEVVLAIEDASPDSVVLAIEDEDAWNQRQAQQEAEQAKQRAELAAREAEDALARERAAREAEEALAREREPLLALARANTLFTEGQKVEYYSRTNDMWLPGDLHVETSWGSTEPATKYSVKLLSGTCKDDIPEDMLRSPLSENDQVEVFVQTGKRILFTYSKEEQRQKDLTVHLEELHAREFKQTMDFKEFKLQLTITLSSIWDWREVALARGLDLGFPVTVQINDKGNGIWLPGVLEGEQPRVTTRLGYGVRLLPHDLPVPRDLKFTRVPASHLRLRLLPGTRVQAHMGWKDGWKMGRVDSESLFPRGIGAPAAPMLASGTQLSQDMSPQLQQCGEVPLDMVMLPGGKRVKVTKDAVQIEHWVMVPVVFDNVDDPGPHHIPSYRICPQIQDSAILFERIDLRARKVDIESAIEVFAGAVAEPATTPRLRFII